VPALPLRGIQCGIRSLERGTPVGKLEYVGNTCRKGDMPDGRLGHAIDHAPLGQFDPRRIEQRLCFFQSPAPEQHDELLTAMTGDVATLTGNTGKIARHRLQHTIASLVPMRVVDALEMV